MGLTSHQQGHKETAPWFKVSSERPEKWGIDLAIPGQVVQCVIHYITAAPTFQGKQLYHFIFASLLNEGNLLKEFAPLRVLGEKSAQQEIYC